MRTVIFETKYCIKKKVYLGEVTKMIDVCSFPNTSKLKLTGSNGLYRAVYEKTYTPNYKIGEKLLITKRLKELEDDVPVKDIIDELKKSFPLSTEKLYYEGLDATYATDHSHHGGSQFTKFLPNDVIEITNIRFSTIQKITDEECLSLGIYQDTNGKFTFSDSCGLFEKTPKLAYEQMLKGLNLLSVWEENCPIMIYTFKLIKSNN